MSRYPPGHKDQTRERLVETAREEFRRRGFDTASIDTLMRAAGLTRGAFYAHFGSKEALVEEVLALPSGLRRALEAPAESGAGTRSAAADAFDRYLDPRDRDERVQCPMVAHPMDARRGGGSRAAIYGGEVRALIEALTPILDGDDEEATRIATLAIGAAILGTAVGDDTLASRIEEGARDEIRRRLGAKD